MKSKRRWFFGLALTLPLVILLLVLSSMQLASADTGQAAVPHWFYGHLYNTSGGDMPAGAEVKARDDAGGVIWTGIDGNPITTEDDGLYGTKDPDNPSITDFNLAVQGAAEDMYTGLPISFYVNDVLAEVRECGSTGDWQTTYPWKSDRKTCLDIRGGEPPEYGLLTVESPDCYSVTVTHDGDDYVVPAGGSEVFTVTINHSVDLEVFDDDVCCTWVGWSDGVTETFRTYTVTGDATLIANSTLVEYNLTINKVGEGTVEPYENDTQLQPCGETVVVTATADPGPPPWSFEGWTGDLVSPAEVETILMDADKEITATFNLGVPTPLTVTATSCYSIEVVGKGIVAGGTTDVFTVTSGSPVELTTVGTCCDLNAWLIDGVDVGNDDPYIFTMPVTPTTVEDLSNGPPFTLTVNVGGGGGGMVDPAEGEHPGYWCGEVVTLTATPYYSSTFEGWSGDRSSMLTETLITMDEDLLVTATFELKTFDLTDIVYPTDTVTPDPEPPWTYGDEVTFTADAISGCYEFTGWSGDLEEYDTLSVTVAITGPMEFAPVYDQLRQVTLTVYTHTFGNPVTVTVEPPGGIYTCGEVVTLTAAPTQTFRYWEENGWQEMANPAMVPMTDDREITAVFGFDPDTLVVTIEPQNPVLEYVTETVQFTVTATDDMGNSGDVTSDATFTTTDGTVDANGVYTPPIDAKPGDEYGVCVTYQGVQECTTVIIEGGIEPVLVGQVGMGNFVTFDGVTLTVRYDGEELGTDVLDANGTFTFTSDVIAAGTYTVCVKEARALAMCVGGVVVPASSPPVVVPFGNLVSGDADNDNTVGFNDLLMLGAYWNTVRHDTNFDNSADGMVAFNDLLILGASWGLSGDPGW